MYQSLNLLFSDNHTQNVYREFKLKAMIGNAAKFTIYVGA